MKITLDTNNRNFVFFILTMGIMAISLIYSARWYKNSSEMDSGVDISISGNFLKNGAIEIHSMSSDGRIIQSEKLQYTPYDTIQVINAFIPITEAKSRIIIQFKKHPSDSLTVRDIEFKTTYSCNKINIKKGLTPSKNNNIVFFPKGHQINSIQSSTKNDFVVVTPFFTPLNKNYWQNKTHVPKYAIVVILLIALLFYKKLSLLSYCFVLISSIVFIITAFLFSSINFRSLIFGKNTSAPCLEIGMRVPIDEKIVLYWENNMSISTKINDEKKIELLVNGAPEFQNFTFQLPNDSVIKKLRLSVGRLPIGSREIKYIRYKKYDKIIDIPMNSIPSYFTFKHNVNNYKNSNGNIIIPINNQNPYIETQNDISKQLIPLYEYRINNYAGYVLSIMISILVFFWLQFSTISRKLSDKQKNFNF